MTAALLAFVTAQSADLYLWSQAPHLEANPAMAALPVAVVPVAKVLGVLASIGIARILESRGYPSMALGMLWCGAVIGALGALSAVVTLVRL